MITDINSLVSGQGKTSSTQTATTSNLGTIAKLNSELKLIDGLHPIQITSVKNAQTTNGNQQLIGVTRSDQQQYTLINDKPSNQIQAGDKGSLNVSGNQVTLTVPNQRPSQNNSYGQPTGTSATSNSTAAPSSTTATQPPISNTAPSSSPTTNTSSSTTSGVTNQQTFITPSKTNVVNTPTLTSQQATTVAQVAIASRPITLTVIRSNTTQQPIAPSSQKSTTPAPTNSQSTVQQPVTRADHSMPQASSTATASLQTSTTQAQSNNVKTNPIANNAAPIQETKAVQQPSSNSTTEPIRQPTPGQNAPTATTRTIPESTQQQTITPTNTAALAKASQPQTNFSVVVTDGNEEFTLNTQHPIKAGEKLTVVIDKQGQMQFYPADKTSPTATTLTEGLRQALPKQVTPQEFVSMIRQLNTLSQSGVALPDKVASALEQLVKQLPSIQNLTQSSDGIKQAIQNSGIFSESNLAKNINITTDFKLNLSRLDGANQEASKQASVTGVQTANSQQAMNLVAGAIERITTNQVRNLIENAQQDGSILPLSIEIPIKDGRSTSVVNLKIDQDKSDSHQEVEPHKRRWLVQLKFDFEETGRFEARASIQDQKVGIIFAVEDTKTEQLIRERLDELRENLRSKQVEIEALDCFKANLDKKQTQYQEPTQRRLIDVRT